MSKLNVFAPPLVTSIEFALDIPLGRDQFLSRGKGIARHTSLGQLAAGTGGDRIDHHAVRPRRQTLIFGYGVFTLGDYRATLGLPLVGGLEGDASLLHGRPVQTDRARQGLALERILRTAP